jgi:hypothetical protein
MMSKTQDGQHRKIDPPSYCCTYDMNHRGGDRNCNHDYPPESKREYATCVEWTCSICGMRTSLGVYE